jgi:hypothetical protein
VRRRLVEPRQWSIAHQSAVWAARQPSWVGRRIKVSRHRSWLTLVRALVRPQHCRAGSFKTSGCLVSSSLSSWTQPAGSGMSYTTFARNCWRSSVNTARFCAMDDHATIAEFAIGSRCEFRAGGRRSSRLQGRKGTVVGFSSTRNAVRVIFDGFKSPQTLHLSYLVPIAQVTSFVAATQDSTRQQDVARQEVAS